jgi:hypothetical protein
VDRWALASEAWNGPLRVDGGPPPAEDDGAVAPTLATAERRTGVTVEPTDSAALVDV